MLEAIEVPRQFAYIALMEGLTVEIAACIPSATHSKGRVVAVECGSCGLPLKRLEVGICELCKAISPMEPIQAILPRVMDEIEQNRKDAA